ncbi:MAG: proton-conducting transporter membrane subunit [Campylobacterota bacterium]|nr:proton-conducting transporter membrane subunit [Campylobacterota bacterium]
MSLTYFFILPLLALFLSPLFKNIYRVVSFALSLSYIYFSFFYFDKIGLREYISYEAPFSISFTLSSASWFFVAFFSFIYLFYTLYHLNEKEKKEHFIMVNILMGSMFGLVLSSDIFNIYIFFEIVSIAAYILTSSNKDKKAYGGAIKYMIIGTIASIFLLLGIMVIYLQLGTLNLYEISQDFGTIEDKLQFFILLCLFIGFGIKAEIFPLNFWVADIYESAPSHITALFSSIVSKGYIFVFFNIAYSLDIEPLMFGFFAFMGLLSFVVAEISAFKTTNIQRLFAYSTLGQLGIIFFAFSLENIALLSAGLFLVVVHAIAKLNIFLGVDVLRKSFKSDDKDIITLFSSYILSFVFIVSFLSILGIPPFAGFVAKLNILSALASLENYIAILVIIVVSLVEGAYLFRLLYNGADKNIKIQSDKKSITLGFFQKLSFIILSLLIIYLGLFSDGLMDITKSAAEYFIKGGLGV